MGVGAASVEPTLTALLSRRAPARERGAIMGFNDAASNVALIVAPVAGGAAIDVDPHLVGIIPGCAAFAAFVLGMWREGGAGASRRTVREGEIRPDPR